MVSPQSCTGPGGTRVVLTIIALRGERLQLFSGNGETVILEKQALQAHKQPTLGTSCSEVKAQSLCFQQIYLESEWG